MLIASLKNFDGELGIAFLESFEEEIIGLHPGLLVDVEVVVVSVVGLLDFDPPHVGCSLSDLPVEPKAIKGTEDIALIIVGPDLQMLLTTDVHLARPRKYFDPVNFGHVDLRI